MFLGFTAITLLICPSAIAQLANTVDKIEVDADSTGADAVSGRLTFTNISIRQGDLSISANFAESSTLDFTNSTWTFRGKVRVQSPGASVDASQLELKFSNKQIRSAQINGAPLRYTANNFSAMQIVGQSANIRFINNAIAKVILSGTPMTISRSDDSGSRTEGQADMISFDAPTENIELLGNARLGEGGNQITGNRITYNLKSQRVLAAANEQGDGRVRIVIDPSDGRAMPQLETDTQE